MNTTIPGLIEDTLADYAYATGVAIETPTAAHQAVRAEALRTLRAAIDIELTKAREEGGRIALEFATTDKTALAAVSETTAEVARER